jgi:hypothetical protein
VPPDPPCDDKPVPPDDVLSEPEEAAIAGAVAEMPPNRKSAWQKLTTWRGTEGP